MNRITFPLKLRMRGPKVADLQEALAVFLERGLILANDPETRRDFAAKLRSEREKRYYGPTTRTLVGIFQRERHLQPTGAVDEPTARALNALLEELGLLEEVSQPEQPLSIRGVVLSRFTGIGIMGLRVEARDKDGQIAEALGAATTDDRGRFEITIDKRYRQEIEARKPDLYFRVFSGRDLVLSTEDSVLWNVKEAHLQVTLSVDFWAGVDEGRSRPKTFTVRGRVAKPDGSPAGGLRVVAVEKDARSQDRLLGTAKTDRGGYYAIRYTAAQLANPAKGSADLMVKVFAEDSDEPVASSPLILNALEEEIINLSVGDETYRGRSEYQVVAERLAPLLERSGKTDLSDQEMASLSNQTGLTLEQVQLYVESRKQAPRARVEPGILYALYRTGMPYSLPALTVQSPEAIAASLKRAQEKNIVAPLAEQEVRDALSALEALRTKELLHRDSPSRVHAATLFEIAGLTDREKATVLRVYSKRPESSDIFWDDLREAGLSKPRVTKLRRIFEFNALSLNHPPLVEKLAAHGEITSLKDLASKDAEGWKAFLEQEGIAPPDPMPGDTVEDKRRNYALILSRIVEDAFPTAYFAGGLLREGSFDRDITGFFNRNPDFAFEETGINTYLKEHPEALEGFADKASATFKLQALQNLFRLSPRFDRFNAVQTLWQDVIRSAHDIKRMGEEKFVARYEKTLGKAQARLIYANAEKVAGFTLLALAKYAWDTNSITPYALPQTNLSTLESEDGRATLESLFGNLDFCHCKHCRSVLGPAAYLVDLLMFLHNAEAKDGQTGLEKLFDRRPDIGDLELNCENATTVLPYIDLVNEVLEDEVAPLPVYTLPGSVEPHLVAGRIKPELRDAMGTQGLEVSEEARVSVIESGRIWTIQDGFGSYRVRKEDAQFTVRLSRQTVGSPAELRAHPQYINPEAYERLKTATYPWTLPFDLWAEEARTYLAQLGVTRHELMEVFRGSGASSPTETDVLCEFLHLTPAERSLLTTSVTNETDLKSLWGVKTGSLLDGVKQADEFLARAHITYAELEALLQCRFINPPDAGDAIRISFDKDNPCSLAHAELTNLDPQKLDRLHRFIRLQKKLDWRFFDLDRALTAFGKTDIDDDLLRKLSLTIQLKERFGVDLLTALSWWAAKLDTVAYKDTPSPYEELFRNRAVGELKAEVRNTLALNATGDELSATDKRMTAGDYKPVILGAARIRKDDLTLIIAEDLAGDETLNLANLSHVVRVASFCQAARLSVPEYYLMTRLSGIRLLTVPAHGATPQHTATPQDTKAFLEARQTIAESGIAVAELAYLLAHDTSLPNNGQLPQQVIAQRLTEIRTDLAAIHAAHRMPQEDLEAALAENLGDILEGEETRNAARLIILGQSPWEKDRQKTFIEEHFAAFLDPGDAKAKLVDPNSLGDDVQARLTYVLEPLLAYLFQQQGRRHLEQKLSESLSVSVAAASALLDVVKNPADGTQSAAAVFLEETFVTGTAPIDPTAHASLFGVYERLYKASRLVNGLKISPDDQAFAVRQGAAVGWPDLNALPLTPLTSGPALTALFERFSAMVKAFQVWPRIRTSGAPLSEFLSMVNAPEATEADIKQLLANHSAWSPADIETLTTNYGFGLADLRKSNWLVTLYKAFSLLKRLGVGAAQAWSWNTAEVTREQATQIRLAVNSKYDNQEWLSIAQALRDPLRERQRDALLDYVMHDKDFKDADDVYAHLLIDPEMSACRDTSRIVLAISSVQLFVQRILMNLERDIEFTYADAKQWKWRKNYRVWEANRKVFLWPENWIYPDLRDDKSPFFKELEDELLQSDLDNASAERALMSYLKKLDEVAHLEVSGLYKEIDKEAGQTILHVVARTQSTPHKYFYRRWINQQCWTAWEHVDADIEGDHLIPVVHNRRLFLFWPKFIEKAEEVKGSQMADVRQEGVSPGDPKKYYEIHIAWTQYRDGKWRETQVSRDFFKTWASAALRPKEKYYFFAEQTDSGELLLRCRLIPPDEYEPAASRILHYNDVTDAVETWKGLKGLGYRKDVTDAVETRIWIGSLEIGSLEGARHWVLNKLPDGDNLYMEFEKTREERKLALWTRAEVDFLGTIDRSTERRATLLTSAEAGFQVMLPHQYPTYTSQAPFFYSDRKRVFFVQPRDVFYNHYWIAETFALAKKSYFPDVAGNILRNNLVHAAEADLLEGLHAPGDRPFFDGDTTYYVGNKAGGLVIDRAKMTLPGDGRTPGIVGTGMAVGHLGSSGALAAAPERNLLVLEPTHAGVPVEEWLATADLYEGLTKLGWKYWVGKRYRFQPFYHPYVGLMIQQLNRYGVEGLYAPTEDHRGLWNGRPVWEQLNRQQASRDDFVRTYKPNSDVVDTEEKHRPKEAFDFSFGGAYSQYNWELFFHVPLLIAERLMQNQKFEEAQKWFHYVFDPTETEGEAPQRFWQIKPFFEYDKEASIEGLMKLLNEGDEEVEAQVEAWENDPFNPHLIARMRTVAYMRTVVMKYIDNLIAWGDSLFRRFSTESLNEATQLYLLAAQILGRRPERIEKTDVTAHTFTELLPKLDEFSNARVSVESSLPWMTTHRTGPSTGESGILDTLYFCIPQNEKLLGYWDTVSDRLFKIRHCMDIEGVQRQPALFEPPIDPGLLVKARAMGLELSSILSDLSAPLPHYRFRVILQRANEFCADVRSLGAALLQALEKRDAEALSLLRAANQVDLLKSLRHLKEQAIEEARHNREALLERKRLAEIRFEHYNSLEFMNPAEIAAMALQGQALIPHIAGMRGEVASAIFALLPTFQSGGSGVGGSPHVTVIWGSQNLAGAAAHMNSFLFQTSSLLNSMASISNTLASYQRRQEEWDLQRDLAEKEIDELERQILAAEIRIEIAKHDLRSHDVQMEQAEEEAEFLESKFTNRELYNWMATQLSALYFQTYQMAYDLAKKAEQCFRHELGIRDSSYIQFGYWDSLKKGLLAGERLQKDLRRLEAAYLELNRREFELTKHISLAQLNPLALLQLKQTGACEFTVPEVVLDLDHPGHYMRRVKAVSLTIPCVVGPYTAVSARLTLLENRVRQRTDTTGGYAYRGLEDSRFVHDLAGIQSIATSSGQQDAGLFELNFGDERYLPFEGAGAVSRWRLELPEDYRQFDYNTISDVILHMRYTAREGGTPFKTAVQGALRESLNKIADILAEEETGLTRIISARHELATEWHRFMHPAASETRQQFTVRLTKTLFPFMFKDRSLKVRRVGVVLLLDNVGDYDNNNRLTITVKLPDGSENSGNLTIAPNFGGQPALVIDANFTLDAEKQVAIMVDELALDSIPPALVEEREGKKRLKPDAIEDMLLVLNYTVES